MRKRKISIIMLFCCTIIICIIMQSKNNQNRDKSLKIGISIYNLDDPFMQSMTEMLEEYLTPEKYNGIPVRYEITDASGSKTKQQEQIQYLLEQECDVLILNPVKPASAVDILNQAESKKIPVILFNREPDRMDLEISENIWYVGTDGRWTGILQSRMLQRAWSRYEDKIDKNHNKKIDYILVEGEQTHYDTIRRTNAFLQEASENLPINQLEGLSADWIRELAAERMENLPKKSILSAEAIICNNDDMALGVYDFYKKHNLKCPLLIGSNKTDEMKELIDDNKIFGTVDTNPEEQIKKISQLISNIQNNQMTKQKIWYTKPQIYYNEKAVK